MRYTILLFLMIISTFVFSQEESKVRKTEIGIDVTSLITSTIGNGINPSISDFPFTIKNRIKEENRYFRIGMGVNVATSLDLFTDQSSKSSRYNLRLGVEKREAIGGRFSLLYGLDLFGKYSKQTIGSSFADIENLGLTFGTSPFLGVQFKINNRIALELESSFSASYTYQKNALIIESNPPDEEKSNQFSARIILPQWLFLIVKF